MTVLTPIALCSTVPLAVAAFFSLQARHAVLFVIIGGWLFLPTAGYDLPGLPDYNKTSAIALALIIGGWFSGKKPEASYHWAIFDFPLLIFCLNPLVSSMSTGLGIYNGLSGVLSNFFFLGVPYLAGRRYFSSVESLRDICIGILIGGLAYVPLCLYEIRMSPQLSNMIYGFFPHSFLQHFRYDGYRPIVFMSHGLMVSLWMALATTVAFWLWRSGILRHIKGVPMVLPVIALAGTAVLCKSANGWITLVLGFCFYYVYRWFSAKRFFLLFLVGIACYPVARITDLLPANQIEETATHFFDTERVGSLGIRLWQEDLFVEQTMKRPWFGWNSSEERLPRDEDGEVAVPMIDAMWLIFFNTAGFVGLGSLYLIFLLGPAVTFRFFSTRCFTH